MRTLRQHRLPLRDQLSSIELCAGAGGQAIGLEAAGFSHEVLVEIDKHACETLRINRPGWNVFEGDLNAFDPSPYRGVDLLAGGLPCPPFSIAGKQLGQKDERNLFPRTIEIIADIKPGAVMIENVKGFLGPKFESYRDYLKSSLERLGYVVDWKLLNASDFGVPQLRPRVVIVAIKHAFAADFTWPEVSATPAPTVGQTLKGLMGQNNWEGVDAWAKKANTIAPTIVGGSKKHGGPDLGPTRAKRAWEELGVNGKTIAEEAPFPGQNELPRLTVPMVAKLQGFPDDWLFHGRKTNAYRQVGNAFPPPVAHAVGTQIAKALDVISSTRSVA